jgi:nitroimidazol reductase NimA-like FMN-containing flavoprotein (pyridoxamine 5'-phosphate oxidase superfamily)
MLGILDEQQIDTFLRSKLIGRLGCSSQDNPYVVPIAYAYDGEFIYGHTQEGKKIDLLRKNPKVCFEVDQIDDLANWRSVVIHGEFEELNTDQKALEHALRMITNRMTPFKSGESSLPHYGMEKSSYRLKPQTKLVTYRIKILERHGRFEKE